MPQTLIKDVGGSIETYFEKVRPATVTVTLYTDKGGVKINAESATVDSVSTSISAAVSAGATTLALTSATSVVAGRSYVLGVDASTVPFEVVTVRSIAASTATVFQPVFYDHNSGDRFSCGRVVYTVPAGSADAIWFDGYAVFTPDTGEPQTEVVDCCLRKIPDYLLDIPGLATVFPYGRTMLETQLDVPRALLEARDQFLQAVGGKVRIQTMIGAQDFKYGAQLQFWLLRRHAFGDEWAATFDRMERDLRTEITKLQSMVPVDADQDGTTSGPFDGGRTSGRVERG